MNNSNWKSTIFRFITAQTISLFGTSLVQYAIIWHITLTTSSGIMMTLSTLCGFLPQIMISLFAGVWLDRYDRKTIMMLADGMIALATLGLAIVFLLGYNSTWLLFTVLAVRSFGTGIQGPAVQAIIPQIVPKEHLMRISGIESSITSVMMFLSPAVSGAILSVAPIEATLFIDVLTAAIGIGIMFTVPTPKRTVPVIDPTIKPEKYSQFADMKEGFAYLKRNVFIKNLLLYLIVLSVLITPSAFLSPIMISRSFGADVWRLTASEMTFSIGALLGGLLMTSWGGFRNRMYTVVSASMLYGFLMICMGIAPTFLLYLIFNTVIGICMPCFNSSVIVLMQERVDDAMYGRVFGLLQVAMSCAFPMGMLFFGPLADMMKIEFLFIITGSIAVIYAFWRGMNILGS